ncbi:MAG: NAD/NADP octopine/nopaline dehydrogenase family protein [bacterium]
MDRSVTIIGAGNSGLAMAAHLSLNGHSVCLWNRSRNIIEDIISTGDKTICVEGVVNGKAKIELVTSDIEEAVSFSKLVMITTPADAHSNIALLSAPYLTGEHTIVLNPGRCFGVVDFFKKISDQKCKNLPTVAETQTILYTCRKIPPNRSLILALKKKVLIASTSYKETIKVIENLPDCIKTHFHPAESLLETSLGNVGMILHCLPVLMNVGWIENKKTSFKYYYDGITPSIAKLLEKIDSERLDVAGHLGLTVPSLSEWLETTYSVSGETLYDKIQSVESYRTIEALDTLQHRYLLEDIPFGLVPIEDIGKQMGLSMKITTLIIELANEIFDFDFREKGRTLKSLGISLSDLISWNKNE